MSTEKTGIFEQTELQGVPCPDCKGTGELRIESENINENFEVEKQTVIAPCPRCNGTGWLAPGS
jgi:DnaJ-class molecular chaperone